MAVGAAATLVALGACAAPDEDETDEATITDAETGEDQAEAKKQFCGGIAGIPCPEKYTCVDDPSDDCDPSQGGADCGGVCVKDNRGQRCGKPDRTKDYISRDPAQCAAISFLCVEGKQPFFDECGCGCQTVVGQTCGDNVCGAGQYCCNASCGLCAPKGGACIQIACE